MDKRRRERLDRMKKRNRAHAEEVKAANRRLYDRRRAAGVCVRCGQQDEGTREGAVRCLACSVLESERRKKRRERKSDSL